MLYCIYSPVLFKRGPNADDPEMMLLTSRWNYHERLESGRGVITTWIKTARMSKKAQANLERTLDQLRQLPKTSWSKPQPASSLGHHTYVIRFREVTGAQLRVFGHFFDDHSAFVMTFEGYEKDNVYYPNDYKKVAKRHRAECDPNFSDNTVKFGNYCALCQPQGDSTNR